MIGFALFDWSAEINVKSFLELIKLSFPHVWQELNVGSVRKGVKKIGYKVEIDRVISDVDKWQECEWYGGVGSKSDPDREWRSYLSLSCGKSPELILSSSLNEFSFDKLTAFVRDASRLGNLGYGIGCERLAEGITYYLSGVSYGIPKTPQEKAEGERLSRWFRERLEMGGAPALKRYLAGMQRGAFPFNVLNSTHVTVGIEGQLSLNGAKDAPGELQQFQNGVYLWSVPHALLKAADDLLEKKGFVI